MPGAWGDLFSHVDNPHSEGETEEHVRLKRSEKLYRHLVENSLGLICSHNFDGQLLTVNNAAAQALGYFPDELIGRNLRELIAPALHGRFDAYLSRIRRQTRARGYLDLLRRDGTVVTWLYRNQVYEEPGSQPVVIGHAQDITWRLHMERTLKDSSERFRALFEDAPVAYHEIDSRGIITRVNRAECELLGRAKEEVLGIHVSELVTPEQRSESRSRVAEKLLGTVPLVPFVREYVRKDGERVIVQIHEKLIRSTSGKILGIRSTLLDVTAEHRIEAELRSLNAELDRRVAERTAELHISNERLKEFVYTVSHDLQEPLRSISSFAGLLQNRYRDRLDTDGVEFLEYVTTGAARMSCLIRDLLQYSRVLHEDAPVCEPVDLTEVVEAAMQNLSTSIASSRARIEYGELPVVVANARRMIQVFQNLLSNAVKYCGDQPPVVAIECSVQDSGWLISVSDNGIGVRPEDGERVFGLFKRSQGERASGSGLGLAICRAVVERHGGRIWVEPRPGGGSVFRFTIQAAAVHSKRA